jgi:hypothetical protein
VTLYLLARNNKMRMAGKAMRIRVGWPDHCARGRGEPLSAQSVWHRPAIGA